MQSADDEQIPNRIIVDSTAGEAEMRMATTTTAAPTVAETADHAGHSRAWKHGHGRFVGIGIASLVPAVFWSVVIELVSAWLGSPLSPTAIAMVGGGIALFLFAVCAPLMLRKRAEERDPPAPDRPTGKR